MPDLRAAGLAGARLACESEAGRLRDVATRIEVRPIVADMLLVRADRFVSAAAALSLMEAAPDPETLDRIADEIWGGHGDVVEWLRACAAFLRPPAEQEDRHG